jgi:hypothetical protein
VTAPRCRATAHVFSGRGDPEWSVHERQLESLRRIWTQLPLSPSAPPAAPPLGYRRLTLECPSGESWFAYGGVVTLTRATGPTQHRRDTDRRFEYALADTAPPHVFPPGFGPPARPPRPG